MKSRATSAVLYPIVNVTHEACNKQPAEEGGPRGCGYIGPLLRDGPAAKCPVCGWRRYPETEMVLPITDEMRAEGNRNCKTHLSLVGGNRPGVEDAAHAMRKRVGQNIEIIRLTRGWNRRELTDMIGCPGTKVRNLERGMSGLDYDDVALALGVTEGFLRGENE